MSAYNKWYYANLDRARALKRDNMRRYRSENPEKHNAQSRAAKAKMRARLLEIYGSSCAECGFGDPRALTLDHILKNGSDERSRLGERGVYKRAIDTYLPDEYRTLCMNCQFIARHRGPAAA